MKQQQHIHALERELEQNMVVAKVIGEMFHACKREAVWKQHVGKTRCPGGWAQGWCGRV
jgi:hypothetical protein